MVPIRCGKINLNGILDGILATRATFHLRYHGLPLSVWIHGRANFQYLENKCAGKLLTWNVRYPTTTSRTSIIKSVIASQVLFYLTHLCVPLEL
jgi:hypothetical protein